MIEHPFDIVTEHGDSAEADGTRPVVFIKYEGTCVLTIDRKAKL